MALKDTWVDKKNDEDIIFAEDINDIANAVIEVEARKAGVIASAEQPDAVDVLWLDTDDADEEDEGYTKAEVDAMFGEYIAEVDALIGGED